MLLDNSDALNLFHEGDFVLFDEYSANRQREKLASRYSDPYTVKEVHKADVTVEHIVTGAIKVFHSSNLKQFHLQQVFPLFKGNSMSFFFRGTKKIYVKCSLFDQVFIWKATGLNAYCTSRQFYDFGESVTLR